jgi:GDP-mannose 6-dehydrogenase
MKVVMSGRGYAGTAAVTCLASHGHDIWGADVDAVKADEIRAGRSPVAEQVLNALTAQAVGGMLHTTTSCLDAVDWADV